MMVEKASCHTKNVCKMKGAKINMKETSATQMLGRDGAKH